MRVISSLGACFLWSVVATAQTPLGSEFVPVSLDIDASVQNGASVSCDDASVCALVWTSAKPNADVNNLRQWARTISPLGELSPLHLLGADEGLGLFIPTLPLNPGFILFGQKGFQSGVNGFWIYDGSFQLQGDFVRLPFHGPTRYGDPDSISGTGVIAAIPGGFVETQVGFDQPEIPCDNGGCLGVFLYFFDLEGHKLRDRVQANQDSSLWETTTGANDVVADGNGNIIVTFYRIYGAIPSDGSRAFVRRFSPAGDPLGAETPVAPDLPGGQLEPAVAASPDSEYLVVWTNKADPQTDFGEIYGRRFGADGEPLGPAFRVSDPIPAQANPKVTADRHGNYFVAWNSLQEFGYDVRGRLYHQDGRPVAGGFRINQSATFDQTGGLAAFAPNGTLTVSYGTNNPAQTGGQLHVPVIRRYAASPGAEPCAVAGARLSCDTGRTGGMPEAELTFGGRPGEVLLLGDWDGDGRDDVCAWRAGRFRCDLNHEGPPAEAALSFGLATDVPLLGDVDGDGRAEPCVRRKRRVLCDTGHDGGKAEWMRLLGRGTEVPLLGDLDGDGKDDACVVEEGRWLCVTGAGRVDSSFGEPGDLAALGDLDGDGREDPCAFRNGALLCDTGHDGGAAEVSLSLMVPAGARPLFGNLDGL